MKTILLITVLLGAGAALNAQEDLWNGTHRVVWSTQGEESFNPKQCKTFCQITEKDGKLTGSITMFGWDALDNSLEEGTNTENLQGTSRKQLVEWRSRRSWEDKKKEKHQYETVVRGVRDGDTIVGYFEQIWHENRKPGITYRGVFELRKQKKG